MVFPPVHPTKMHTHRIGPAPFPFLFWFVFLFFVPIIVVFLSFPFIALGDIPIIISINSFFFLVRLFSVFPHSLPERSSVDIFSPASLTLNFWPKPPDFGVFELKIQFSSPYLGPFFSLSPGHCFYLSISLSQPSLSLPLNLNSYCNSSLFFF